jgi:hypothetical protein
VLLIVAVIIKFIWWILAVAGLAAAFYLVRALVRENRRRTEAYDRYCEAIAAQADEQNQWVTEGDERGVYGPGGVELMNYIGSGAGATIPKISLSPGTALVAPPKPFPPWLIPAVVVGGGIGFVAIAGSIGNSTAPAPTPAPSLPSYPPTYSDPSYSPTPAHSVIPTVAPPSAPALLPPTSSLAPSSTMLLPPVQEPLEPAAPPPSVDAPPALAPPIQNEPGGAPTGATAICRDGSYSYSHHHSGTCSGHHGVGQWLG